MLEFKPQMIVTNCLPHKIYEAPTQAELLIQCCEVIKQLIADGHVCDKTDGQLDMWNPGAGYSLLQIANNILDTEDDTQRLVRAYHFLMTNLTDKVQIILKK